MDWLYSYGMKIIGCCLCGRPLRQADKGNVDSFHDAEKSSYCQSCTDDLISKR